MIGNKNKFHTLKEVNEGNVTFGNTATARIGGKGTLSLPNGKTKINNVLYVEGFKHNVFIASQMCDQGHTHI
jgi:hypothetical protein